eukprot:CAMPEP_0180553050 /NCGR_PEP_ID=MMETSP1036_2-20121128/74069_1 /TAXON_ID=632150 /ORGANISM="Azadinium spinosum, Strain 3D9" /LENGTH=51 /DNA_ID=CAMNT_0022568539 /DNA_START=30 /DNA_END=182 /DNA_ORIENTATION=+
MPPLQATLKPQHQPPTSHKIVALDLASYCTDPPSCRLNWPRLMARPTTRND